MKKEIFFIALMLLLGIFLGYSVMIVVAAISTPGLNNAILTKAEHQDYQDMYNFAQKGKSMLWLNIILLIITYLLLLNNLNPNFLKALTKRETFAKAIVIFIPVTLLFILFISLLFRSSYSGSIFFDVNTIDPGSGGGYMSNIFFILIFGLIWVLLGEMGWAGDFSSWGTGTKEKEGKLAVSFILGGLVGFAIMGLSLFGVWMFNNYLLLVTEVLDKSGDVSYLGMILLRNASMFIFGMIFTIFAGIITACAPVYRDTKGGMFRLIFPIILIIIMVFVAKGKYNEAIEKYDWDRLNLANIINVNEISSEVNTVIIFKTKTKKIKQKKEGGSEEIVNVAKSHLIKWPMQVEGYGVITGKNQIEVNQKSLAKVEKFIEDRKDGSMYQYVARDVLYKGYYRLWDIDTAMEKQLIAAESMLLPRILLLVKLQWAPITEKNYRYVKEFSNEDFYIVGGNSAFNLVKALVHFNKLIEAEKWLYKTKAGDISENIKDDLKEYKIPETVLTNGKISGKITLNNKPIAGTKVGLFKDMEYIGDLKYYTFERNIIEVVTSDAEGNFTFENLGEGYYNLGIMVHDYIISYNLPENLYKIENSPEVITLSVDNPEVDLKTINFNILKEPEEIKEEPKPEPKK